MEDIKTKFIQPFLREIYKEIKSNDIIKNTGYSNYDEEHIRDGNSHKVG